MKNVFIIRFLNQSILNYMLKYTPVKTYMNTSRRYCTTKIDFTLLPIDGYVLCGTSIILSGKLTMKMRFLLCVEKMNKS